MKVETKTKNRFCNLYEVDTSTSLHRILSGRKNTALLQFSTVQHHRVCHSFSIGHILLYSLPGAAERK